MIPLNHLSSLRSLLSLGQLGLQHEWPLVTSNLGLYMQCLQSKLAIMVRPAFRLLIYVQSRWPCRRLPPLLQLLQHLINYRGR
jgi:hypothetical protein